jgi:hypothetical protein
MAICEFEYMHGAVLSKILRKDEPLQLTLIETNAEETNSIYRIISKGKKESILYIKHSKAPKIRNRNNAKVWTFTFSVDNLRILQKYLQENIILALVCAQKNFKSKGAEVCVLQKDEILQHIDVFASNQQTFSVSCEPNKSLRVRGTMTNTEDIIVERNRINSIIF